jgi:hypothetical protein
VSFTPRSQQEVVDSLLAFASSDPDVAAGVLPSDLNVGSLERAHLESMGLLLEEGEQRMAMAVVSAISESCFRAFGFDFLPPQKASGGVVFTAFSAPVADVTIPSGSQLLGPSGTIFETTAPGVILAGQLTSANVPIRCTVPGVVGNVAQDSITRLVAPIANVDMVTNSSRTMGGADTESADARAVRFAAFLRTLVRGTKEALEFAALSASNGVWDARTVEPFMLDPRPDGVPYSGLVWLFVDDGSDAPILDVGVSSEVTKLVEGYVDQTGLPVPGYKGAGTRVELKKVPRTKVMVRGTISLRPGGGARWGEIQTALSNAAASYFDRLRIGEKASYQTLVTFLTSSDPDVSECDLSFWKYTDSPPAYDSALSASDLVFYSPSIPLSVGARGVLFSGAALGPLGSPVTYPEWRLA